MTLPLEVVPLFMRPTRVATSIGPDSGGVPGRPHLVPICYGTIKRSEGEGVVSIEVREALSAFRNGLAILESA
jgi:hypothetical protein